MNGLALSVIPAPAGIQTLHAEQKYTWMPASAGMTKKDKTLQAGVGIVELIG